MVIGTGKNTTQFQAFIDKVNGMADGVRKAGHEKEAKGLQEIAANFQMKTEDFYRKNRKLNIGVVGQVKAGKSSFLNTLLFGGKEVLPKAATPKTATLTKMEYAEENSIEIEYYSASDWKILEENAKVDSDEVVFTSARELIQMASKTGIDPQAYIAKGTETVPFSSYDNLVAHLNDYVGADGKVTPLVKSVTLHLHKEEFKGLSIVDTPGLNDPIVSRTIRTREFMEVCDVVFFLSQAGSFLDKSDWELLSAQLPQKGVKRLVLIASKYDSGIRDILRVQDEYDVFGDDDNSTDSVPKACKIIHQKLTKRAKAKVEEFASTMQSIGSSPALISVIRQCAKPIMVSAMAYNMSQKDKAYYTKEEQNLASALQFFSKNLLEDLSIIGNFDEVQELFGEVAKEKEKILGEKARSFIPIAEEEVKGIIRKYQQQAERHLQILAENDHAQLMVQKAEMEAQMGHIRADVASVFGDIIVKMEQVKMDGVQALREAGWDYTHLDTRTGSKQIQHSRYVSDSKWYKPWSWGSGHTVHWTESQHYSYCLATDAVENLRNYASESKTLAEEVFTEAIDLRALKRKLLNVVIRNFDTGSENYDASLFRIMVENEVNQVELPIFSMDVTGVFNDITGQFSGEITGGEMTLLATAMQVALEKVFNTLSNQLNDTVISFKKQFVQLQNQTADALLQNITDEFNALLDQCKNKESEISGYEAYISLLQADLKQI